MDGTAKVRHEVHRTPVQHFFIALRQSTKQIVSRPSPHDTFKGAEDPKHTPEELPDTVVFPQALHLSTSRQFSHLLGLLRLDPKHVVRPVTTEHHRGGVGARAHPGLGQRVDAQHRQQRERHCRHRGLFAGRDRLDHGVHHLSCRRRRRRLRGRQRRAAHHGFLRRA